ncbi:hypothetical protein HHO38_17725 [Parabacteroides distasonis]|uniref:23S rRNA (Adenine(2030)-N(6))-methyltransferase RlmJ n=1 Tax=Parabacteroides distasonis TaxID=823 RepID=A0A7L5EFU8_PARDI|nr:hypothetical protein [Parabacteroides distasonis]QJE30017.1 hypothetical protein HHO38_17725 [Parabacteroides distasonis]WRY45234.1 hypothetical protein P8F78_08680 [Parabacteroides distasonis]
MVAYTHFGKQPDVFKHLILCEVLHNEKPQVYVETNSACAIYTMTRTPEQEYGIYHFLNEVIKDSTLNNSLYYQLENENMANGNYLGSPALAMKVLNNHVQEYLFFDLEESALENIESFAAHQTIIPPIKTFNCDSIEGALKLLPSLPQTTFLHIDPYEIDKRNNNGYTYLDVLINATRLGMKCLLWYGFMTINDKTRLNKYVSEKLKKANIKDYTCSELIMNAIRKDTIVCNPGILGSGILATNLSQYSNAMIQNYSKKLVEIYKNAQYKKFDGSLYNDTVRKKQNIRIKKHL